MADEQIIDRIRVTRHQNRAKGNRLPQRLYLFAGIVENMGEILMGNCQITTDLGGQKRIKL